MIESILLVLNAGLTLWNNESKLRYKKKVFELQKSYYEETKSEDPDHAVLDNIEFELKLLCRSFSSEIAGQASKDMPG